MTGWLFATKTEGFSDTMLTFCDQYANTYYHVREDHIRAKNPAFGGQVYIQKTLYDKIGISAIIQLKNESRLIFIPFEAGCN